MMAQSEWTSSFLNEGLGLLHGDVWHLQFDSSINPEQPDYGWQKYMRSTSARFQCTSCRRSWPSNRVMVVFHMRLTGGGAGMVKVKCFRQNCKTCSQAPMVDPIIAAENITVLMKNLVKKIRIKCYHESLDQNPYYHEKIEVKSPHEPAHCEGCMAGVCTRE